MLTVVHYPSSYLHHEDLLAAVNISFVLVSATKQIVICRVVQAAYALQDERKVVTKLPLITNKYCFHRRAIYIACCQL